MKTFYSPIVKSHSPSQYFSQGAMQSYPETVSRIDSILKSFESRAWETTLPDDHGIEPILICYSKAYCTFLQTAYLKWVAGGGSRNGLIPDTFSSCSKIGYSRSVEDAQRRILVDLTFEQQMGSYAFDTAAVITETTFLASYWAVQTAISALQCLLSNPISSTFALVRPPGHHSASDLAGGFCYFNNVAIAVSHLLRASDMRVCILDIDYHMGNGTQEIFYEQSNPLVISIHGENDYPFFSGSSSEKGAGKGLGYNLNFPLPANTGDKAYLKKLNSVIEEFIIPFKPELLVVSLGVDTYEGDPVGKFSLSKEAFVLIGKTLKSANCKVLFVFEGGYAVDCLGENVCNVLGGFSCPDQL